MKLYTIGFTKKSAETFFTRLTNAGVKRLVDVRLNNVSQLAGFTKRDDLRYFTRVICNIDYVHIPDLAPTQDILDAYKKQKGDWGLYERQFLDLMRSRHIEKKALARHAGRWLFIMQRGKAAPLPPPTCCRVPQGMLAGC